MKAINSPEADNWIETMQEELHSLQQNHTWDLERRSFSNRCRWIFKVKSSPASNKICLKARLVAKGYSQVEGIDYKETFAPVVRYDSIRIILAQAAIKDLELGQFDIKTAFLNGILEKEVYMEPPEGLKVKDKDIVCHLKKSCTA